MYITTNIVIKLGFATEAIYQKKLKNKRPDSKDFVALSSKNQE